MRAKHAAALDSSPALDGNGLAIARSVLYASLFGYPLTLAQLRQTLIESVQTPSEILSTYDRSDALRAVVEYRDGLFFPRGACGLVEERRRREAHSRRFLAHHRLLLGLICALPYVRMVALSGSIAHLNLEGRGDLDLFIVTRGPRVWSVTVAVLVLAKLMRQRQTLCANFVVSDARLALDQQDLFTASQIIHLKPLAGHRVYRELLASNPFVRRFYPNFHHAEPGKDRTGRRLAERVKGMLERVLVGPSAVVESICRVAYRSYLVRRSASWRSPEQVRLESDCLKLHTQSHRQSVLERFDCALRQALD